MGNYALAPGSPAIDYIPSSAITYAAAAPSTDFFGNPRKTPANPCVDMGAVDVAAGTTCAGGRGGGTPPPFPTLPVLDNFNRANANNLGSNWTQLVVLGTANLRVNSDQAICGAAFGCGAGPAEWNPTTLGNRQAAACTFASAPSGTETLLLKTSGSNLFGVRQNAIEVQYSGGTVTVSTFINFSTSTIGSLSGSFANGDTIAAMADQNGVVYVWKTSGTTTTYLGRVTPPSNALWSSGGQIGFLLSSTNARVGNFAGGNVP